MSRYTEEELVSAITEAMDMAYDMDVFCSVVEREGKLYGCECEAENGQHVVVPSQWIEEFMGDAPALAEKILDCED